MINSGPIPSPSKGSECFSRLFSLHAWFCLAAGYNYIGNFDYFWTRHDLYKSDGLHLNMEGVVQLISNLIHFIAFGLSHKADSSLSYSPTIQYDNLEGLMDHNDQTAIKVVISDMRTSHSSLQSATPSNLIYISCHSSHCKTSSALSDSSLNNPSELKSRKGLGLIHRNIRSLLHPQKLEHVKLLTDQANPDVVVLSETWLKSNVNDDQVALTDFNIF